MAIADEWIQKELNYDENEIVHRNQMEEFAFYRAVSQGDVDYVGKNCDMRRFSDQEGVGMLSRDQLTNLKYHFVITAAMIARYCADEGMGMEQAYRLSDFYILKLDGAISTEAVVALHDQMALDFTEKMRLLKKSLHASKPIADCVEYIYSHIRERITVDALASHVGLSANYLSRLFKKEMGSSISDFIREKKIEKAKNILKYSDCNSIEIANYLSFSSQSHFIQLFKKSVGMTPKKYRQLNSKISFDKADENS